MPLFRLESSGKVLTATFLEIIWPLFRNYFAGLARFYYPFAIHAVVNRCYPVITADDNLSYTPHREPARWLLFLRLQPPGARRNRAPALPYDARAAFSARFLAAVLRRRRVGDR